MYDWMEGHPEINRSQLFREAVELKIKGKSQHVSSLMFLASVMGTVFSVVLIGVAIVPSWLNIYVRGMLLILGGILGITTITTYYREQKKVRQ